MAEDRQVNDVPGFCRLLEASGLVGDEELELILAEFRETVASQSRFGGSLTGLTQFLIGRGIITAWQCALLRKHQYKGFQLDQYVMLDKHGDGADHGRYVVEDSVTRQLAILCAKWPTTSPPKWPPEYG